jgi:hypothetical protein
MKIKVTLVTTFDTEKDGTFAGMTFEEVQSSIQADAKKDFPLDDPEMTLDITVERAQ